MNEVVLANLDGEELGQRIQVVLIQRPGLPNQFELRHQSWGDNVGWFTQNSLALDLNQVSDLKNFLGTSPSHESKRSSQNSRSDVATQPNKKAKQNCFADGFQPRLFNAG